MASCQSLSPDPHLGNKFLFTDASSLPRCKVAAWAGMLISREDSWLIGGEVTKRYRDTTFCELLAVAKSLEHFSGLGSFTDGDRITVCSDNLVVTQILSGEVRPKLSDGRLRAAIGHVEHFVNLHTLAVTYSWVPSHQGQFTTDWRCLINARVDREARMRARQVARERQIPVSEVRD